MRSITTHRLAAAALGLSLALPASAWSQTVASAATPAAAQTEETRHANVEQRIADLHASLHITAAQDQAWGAFSQVMLDNAQSMQDSRAANATQADARTAPDVMQGYAQATMLHAQNMAKLSAAFGTLYAVLTPDQKTMADTMFRMKADERGQKQGG